MHGPAAAPAGDPSPCLLSMPFCLFSPALPQFFAPGVPAFLSADAAVEAEGGEGQAVEPTIGGEAHPGLLTRAAEAGGQMASRAAGSVKHAAAKATGAPPRGRRTAPAQFAPGNNFVRGPAAPPAPYPAAGTAEEQQAPGERLEELQRSIAQMERERAGDVEFQRASKELGM